MHIKACRPPVNDPLNARLDALTAKAVELARSVSAVGGKVVSGEVQRVVVTLDAASENHTAIDTAAKLAAHAKARLHGIFVEDEDLWRLAGLPFARQVSTGTGTEPLTQDHIGEQLRTAAECARQEIAAVAERHRIAWSFEVVRGSTAAALACASERDLVVAGALTRPVAGHFRVEARWWSSLDAVSGTVLLARRPWAASGSVLIMLRDRSARSARLLDAAARMAQAKTGALTVIGEPRLVGSEGFEAWLAKRLASYSLQLDIEIATGDGEEMHERLSRLDCGLLAVEAGSAGGGADRLRASFEHLRCDLLIVR
jgi:hypothetical protein